MNSSEMNPQQFLELAGNYWLSSTLQAAIKLDVFTVIGKDDITDEAVAERLKGSLDGVKKLLNALTAMNVLKKKNGKYSNTESGVTFLSKTSPQYVGHMIMVYHHMADSWLHLDQAIITGEPVKLRPSQTDDVYRKTFLKGMYTLAMGLAPRIAKKVDLSKRHNLLDLGGGPGIYAIHFCLQNPQLKATIYDFPASGPFAEENIEKFGLSERINFQGGNYLEEEVEGIYDVAWLSQVLHSEGPDDCQIIIKKAISTLKPGGMIIIHDMILNDQMDGPLLPALFSLNMLLFTPSGQSYSQEQIREMLNRAGVKRIERLQFKGPHESGILTGIV